MTTLSNKLRDQIVDSVIESTTIPARKEDLIKRTEARVRELCISRVPAEFYDAVKTLPAEWFPHTTSESMKPTVCPIAIVKLSEDDLRKAWSHTVSFEVIKHPYGTRFGRNPFMRSRKEDEADRNSWEYNLEDLIADANKIVADEKAARSELRRFLFSVRTYAHVIEKMSEIEPHLPDYVKPMPLTVPVAPLLDTLGKLGFKGAA